MKNVLLSFILLSLCSLLGSNVLQGQIGVLSMSDDLTLNANSDYEVEVQDLTGAGTGHDQVAVTGDLSLGGTLDIILSGYAPVDVDAFQIMSYNGTLAGTFATINWPADMVAQAWVIDYGIIYPGFVTILGPQSVVPVEFISFEIKRDNGVNLLEWLTASEVNNDYFSIEMSKDGQKYTAVDRVSAKIQNEAYQEYNFAHEIDQDGRLFYRLQQVDLDGQFEYSEVVSIYADQEDEITLYPNPTTGKIYFNEVQSGIMVYSFSGKQVMNMDESSTSYDLSSLPSGTFLIRTKGSNPISRSLIINN